MDPSKLVMRTGFSMVKDPKEARRECIEKMIINHIASKVIDEAIEHAEKTNQDLIPIDDLVTEFYKKYREFIQEITKN